MVGLCVVFRPESFLRKLVSAMLMWTMMMSSLPMYAADTKLVKPAMQGNWASLSNVENNHVRPSAILAGVENPTSIGGHKGVFFSLPMLPRTQGRAFLTTGLLSDLNSPSFG